jgi:hypothetical protein
MFTFFRPISAVHDPFDFRLKVKDRGLFPILKAMGAYRLVPAKNEIPVPTEPGRMYEIRTFKLEQTIQALEAVKILTQGSGVGGVLSQASVNTDCYTRVLAVLSAVPDGEHTLAVYLVCDVQEASKTGSVPKELAHLTMKPVSVTANHKNDPDAKEQVQLYGALYYGPMGADPARSGEVNETVVANLEMAFETIAINRLRELAGLPPFTPNPSIT